jgi:hypothetical protein
MSKYHVEFSGQQLPSGNRRSPHVPVTPLTRDLRRNRRPLWPCLSLFGTSPPLLSPLTDRPPRPCFRAIADVLAVRPIDDGGRRDPLAPARLFLSLVSPHPFLLLLVAFPDIGLYAAVLAVLANAVLAYVLSYVLVVSFLMPATRRRVEDPEMLLPFPGEVKEGKHGLEYLSM